MTAYLIRINAVSVRRVISRRHLTHKEVAKKLGTTARYWSQMLANYRRPGAEMRKRITRLFAGCSFEQLFSFEGDADELRAS